MPTSVVRFIKDWTLVIAIVLGAASYFCYMSIPALTPYRRATLDAIAFVQPVLLFSMLFVSFCKVDPMHLKLRRWHIWLLLFQSLTFGGLALMLLIEPSLPGRVCVEGMMICLICPTATSAGIITNKLGGEMEGLVTYTILINIVVALAIPSIVPLIHPNPVLDFSHSFWLIMGKVFPMLICPFFAAIIVRYIFPTLHRRILDKRDMAFYLWAISLALAIAISTKSMMHSSCSGLIIFGLGAGSLLTCFVQFWLGRRIGSHYNSKTTCSQSLGQKATVFAIWAGYTFLDPLCSIAGGFYSIWHNLWNTYQLRQVQKKQNANS